MKDLIERLEKAAGPDRGLDYMIAEAVGLKPTYGATGSPGGGWHDYTASIDAALTLVLEGYSWRVYCHPKIDVTEPTARSYADVYKLAPLTENVSDRKLLSGPHEGEAQFAAIAICIAALRARDAI